MNTLARIRTAAASVVLAAALSAPALAQARDATITFHGGSAAFIAGVSWGGGELHYKGHTYPLKVGGLSFGAIGANGYRATGVVHHLHHLRDLEGVYAAVDASATAGPGAGTFDMKNANGVEIHVVSSSAGLKLSLAPSGVNIQFK